MQSQAIQPAGNILTDSSGLSAIAAWKWIAAIIVATWVSIPHSVQILLCMASFDYASGIARAIIKHEFCASKLGAGFVRKCLMLLLLAATHKATDAFHVDFDIAGVVVLGFIVNEFASVARNCKEAGLPIPQIVVDFMANAKNLLKRPTGK
jgi:toxin secretion/phage lysis holin